MSLAFSFEGYTQNVIWVPHFALILAKNALNPAKSCSVKCTMPKLRSNSYFVGAPRVRQGALGGHRLGQRAPSGRMTRRRRPWDRHRELADKDTASRWPSSAKSMFDGDGNADRPIYISQTSASSRSSYFTREGLRRARSFRRRPNRVHRTRLGRTAHTRQSNRGRGRMRDRTRSPEYDGSSSGLVS